MPIDRTAYFNAIRAKFPSCRFVPGSEPETFRVEHHGRVIAEINDSKLVGTEPGSVADSIGIAKKPVPKKTVAEPVHESPKEEESPVFEPLSKRRGRPKKIYPALTKPVLMNKDTTDA